MRRTVRSAAAAILAVIGATPAQAAPDLAEERKAIEQYQALDQRLQDIGWKLVTGNARFCAEPVPSIGLQLHDLASYGSPEIARAALGMRGSFAVQTAARGSPAETSGAFTRNREIARINAFDPNDWETDGKFDWQRLVRVHDWIDETLQARGAVTFTFDDGTTSTPAPVEVCPTHFEMAADGKIAVADGERVVFGVAFPGFAYEEAVFAGGVAHELAHNLLGHRAWLKANGRKRSNVRRAEREADRLMPWLLANAGYDPEAAVTFMQTWGPKHDGGLLRNRTHDGWDERVKFIRAELPRIRALMAQHGAADWATHFERDSRLKTPPKAQ